VDDLLALLLVVLVAASGYAAGRVHGQLGYRRGYRFGYRQGYADGEHRRPAEQLTSLDPPAPRHSAALLRGRPAARTLTGLGFRTRQP
jgi:hypothetical protein